MRRCVLLIDMGGPRSLAEVRPYLRRIFSDPCILPGGAVRRWFLSHLIARRLAARSRARYASIGGKSRAVETARALAAQLQRAFAERGLPVSCAVATRYSFPDIKRGLLALRDRGGPVTPVYLFPHETTALAGSCERVLRREAGKLGVAIERDVRHLGLSHVYAQGWAEAIQQALERPAESFVIFSAHSLPLSIVRRGDPYVAQVEQSVTQIRARIGDKIASALAYQSQEGEDWLGPDVRHVAARARRQGYRDLIVAPLSFFSDNTETLVDLDQDLRRLADELRYERFVRLETPHVRGFLSPMVAAALCQEWNLEA